MVAFERITIDPERMGGLPAIRDTRVTVSMILGQLAAGRTTEAVLEDYPYLERDDILAALEYAALRDAGYDAVHVTDFGLLHGSDDEIFDRALADERTVITADSDFGTLLAMRRTSSPSVIHLRQVVELGPDDHIALLVANLPALASDLARGAIVSLSPTRLAIRDLPIA
jgi:uncharacterized protein (DUF433 family)